jgi:hypothetical protein
LWRAGVAREEPTGLAAFVPAHEETCKVSTVREVSEVSIREQVQRLAADRPDWLPILRAAVTVAKQAENFGGQFAGRWVLQEWVRQTNPEVPWQPGLRTLAAYELIVKAGPSTRGGRRAYWRMPDRAEIDEALTEMGV